MIKQELCPFFGRCGGCLYQDLSPEAYQQKKENFIRYAFRDAEITDIPLSPIVIVPLHTRRRVNLGFTGNHLGYYAKKSHTIVDITQCTLLHPALVDFLPTLRLMTTKLNTTGEIYMTTTGAGLDILIKAPKKNGLTFSELEFLTGQATKYQLARLVYNNTPIIEQATFKAAANTFLQPSAEGEKILIDLVMQQTNDAHKALDLFCGGGTFTRPLLDKGIHVMGYDCADNVAQLNTHGTKRDLFRWPLTAEEMQGIDFVVINPPRAGAKAQITELAKTSIPTIIMVSCAPKNAARDSKILMDAGWTLTHITPVDQFTWSNHIEIVCVFQKEKK